MKKTMKKLGKSLAIQIAAFGILIGGVAFAAVAFPTATPAGQTPGGKFMQYFTDMIGTGDCADGESVVGFKNGTLEKVCKPFPIIGICGSVDGKSIINQPSTTLQKCGAGIPGTISDNGTSYSWSCSGRNGGASANCSAIKVKTPIGGTNTLGQYEIVWTWQNGGGDPVRYEWSLTGATFINKGLGLTHKETGLSCNTTYTRKVKAVDYIGDSTTLLTLFGKTTACPINGVCGTNSNTCISGTNSGYNAGSCGGNATWSCNGINGGTNATNCSKANGACAINGVCGTNANTCISGTNSGYNAGSCGGNATWSCNGINGGTNATNCSKANGACPVNCVGSWSDTSTCSKTCGGGVKQQLYTITTAAANGGTSCTENNGATKWGTTSCNTGTCYTYSWTSSWGFCDAKICSNGTEYQNISCLRSDGITVADSFCTSVKPKTTTRSCYNFDPYLCDNFGDSDIRLKEKIVSLTGSLKSLEKLRGVSFDWKKDGRSDIGFIAQEIEKIFPELVRTNKSTGYKQVEYIGVIPVLVEALKEYKNKNDVELNKLNNEILSQKKDIEFLKSEIEKLKSKK